MPSRVKDVHLYDEGFKNMLNEHLMEAMENLQYQCAYAFKKYPHSMSVVAVAIVGDYWAHRSVLFSDVHPLDNKYTIMESRWQSLDWPPPVAFGTAQSNHHLEEL